MVTKIEFVPCIPFKKSWVRGYYEKRNGRLVYIRPYENSKSRMPGDGETETQNVETNPMRLKVPKPDSGVEQTTKPMTIPQIEEESMNWLLNLIISCLKQIRSFEEGEIARLAPAVLKAKSIIKELGYYDPSMEQYFEIPQVKPTRLESDTERETEAMAKKLKKNSRRITKSTLKEKVQQMGAQLEAAL